MTNNQMARALGYRKVRYEANGQQHSGWIKKGMKPDDLRHLAGHLPLFDRDVEALLRASHEAGLGPVIQSQNGQWRAWTTFSRSFVADEPAAALFTALEHYFMEIYTQ